jgi:flagellar basal-body rod modification protein FlgD
MSILDATSAAAVTDLGLGKPQEPQKERNKLGQSDFLNLMVAQLKNQDPFSPMDNRDFIAQMAQFSTVSGIDGLQKSFGDLSGTLQSNQALQASTLVGRSVLIPAATMLLPEEGDLEGVIDLPANSGSVSLTIENPRTGEIYRHLDLGQQSAGKVDFSWDGYSDDGQQNVAGMYRIKAAAVYDGKNVSLGTSTVVKVDSVTLGGVGKEMALNVKEYGTFELSSVREIQ